MDLVELVEAYLAVSEGGMDVPSLTTVLGRPLPEVAQAMLQLGMGSAGVLARDRAEPLVRRLIREGRYDRMAAEVARVDPVTVGDWGLIGTSGAITRELRRAMLAGNRDRFLQLTWRRKALSTVPFWADPVDLDLLARLSGPFALEAFQELARHTVSLANPDPGLVDLALARAEALKTPDLAAPAADLALLTGRFDAAERVASIASHDGVVGALHLIRGRAKAAIAPLARRMSRIRVGRHLRYPDLTGVDLLLVPLAYLLDGTASRVKQGHGLIARSDCAMDMAGPFHGWTSLARWSDPSLPPPRSVGTHPLAVLLDGLTRAWTGQPVDRERVDPAIAKADRIGWKWVAAELRALDDPSAALPGTQPLVGLRTVVPEWEVRLARVERALAGPATEPSTTRLAWFVRVKPLQIELREQHLQPLGWSSGRPIGLDRLLAGAGRRKLELEPEDQRIAAALRVKPVWRGLDYEWVEPDVFLAMIGHPRVFTPDEQPLTVAVRAPGIRVDRSEDALFVALSPPMPPAGVSVEVVGTGLVITQFDERQAELARELGTGLRIPRSASARADQLLTRLGEVFERSDAETTGTEGDPTVLVKVWQVGPKGWSADFVVRPLGPHGPSASPGEEPRVVLGVRDGRALRATRDLARERALEEALWTAVPVLRPGRGWHRVAVGGLREVLELLEALQAQDPPVPVEWGAGERIRLRGSIGSQPGSVSVGGAEEWFQVRGSFRVDAELTLSLTELLARLTGPEWRFVRLDDGAYLAVTESLRRKLRDLGRVGRVDGDGLSVHPLAADLVGDLVDETRATTDQAWRDRLRSRTELPADPPVPAGLRAELRAYQVQGFHWLARMAHLRVGACLADDMGLGKTVTALALLLHRAEAGPALVVAPTSVGSVWQAEAARFAPDLRVHPVEDGAAAAALPDLGPGDLVVCSYGVLVHNEEVFTGRSWATVVADEAQQVKNSGTRRHHALVRLTGQVRVALTGTPIENHLGDLWSLFAFLNPGLLGSAVEFGKRFARPVESGDQDVARQLHRLVLPFVLRRTKEGVLADLPPRTEIDRAVDLEPAQAALYEAARIEALRSLEDGDDTVQVLAHLTRLRLAACHPRLVTDAAGDRGAKLTAFAELVGTLREEGHRALVFSQFVRHLSLVREHLDREGIAYQYLDGQTPPDERARRVAAFQAGEGLLFLISLRAGGFGLNLTAADYVVHLDPWWNPAVEDQASDRAHRIGQTRPVTVYRLVARGTIEERILQLHATKRDLADRLLAGADGAARLTRAEMAELLRTAP